MKHFTRSFPLLFVAVLVLAGCQTVAGKSAPPAANVRLPALFTDNMVLQRDMKVPVWGWGDPGGRVTVSIAGCRRSTTVAEDGTWEVKVGPLKAGGPYELSVDCAEPIALQNVLAGEVWVCSGQSNMQWSTGMAANAEQEVASANFPEIRLFSVPRVTSFEPKNDLSDTTGWVVCSPETVGPFSAVGYFFGRYLHECLGVPVGLINSSWGGTVAEAWTSEETLHTLPDFAKELETIDAQAPHIEELAAEYEQALEEWKAAIQAGDAGHRDGEPIWATPDLDTSDWGSMDLPGFWENKGAGDFDGLMWFRKEVEIPEEAAGQACRLCLGPINDGERTWFNGQLVGSEETIGRWMQKRVYWVPKELVKAGRNVIAVRVIDAGNRGGFCGAPEDLRLEPREETGVAPISLAGAWQYKPGLDLKDSPQPQPPAVREGNPNLCAVLHNAMITPLIPYGIAGAIWYQGESNAGRAYQYRSLFPAMIRDWRMQWGQGKFPFLFVQLANWLQVKPEPADDPWAELREAQLMTLDLPKTGMAVIIDIGEAEDIHPRNKQDVGKRLGLAAQKVAYGERLVFSGPIFRSMKKKGSEIRLRFDHVGSGLVAKGDKLEGFAIAGADRKFVWADARIEKDTVVVSSPEVSDPVAVRYAWAINPVCNLYNQEGLPASPFRTDSWPGVTEKTGE